MEEILASIRKIISEDNPEAAPAAAPAPVAASQPAPVAQDVEEEDDSEVLELTQEVAEAPPRPAPTPAPQPPPAPEPPPVVLEAKPEEIVFEPIPQRAAADSGDSGIFSDRTRQAMADTFDSIPDEPTEPEPQRYQPQQPMAAEGSSVESVFERAVRESFEPVLQQYLTDNSQVVIERMKPLIREWMDEKFPALLENAVRGEVEKIVKARTRR